MEKVRCRACCAVVPQVICKTVFYAAMRPATPTLPVGSILFHKAKNIAPLNQPHNFGLNCSEGWGNKGILILCPYGALILRHEELIFNRVIKALGRSAPKKKVSLGRKAKRYFRNPAERLRRIGSSQALSLYIFFHGIMAVECLFHVYVLLDRSTQKKNFVK